MTSYSQVTIDTGAYFGIIKLSTIFLLTRYIKIFSEYIREVYFYIWMKCKTDCRWNTWVEENGHYDRTFWLPITWRHLWRHRDVYVIYDVTEMSTSSITSQKCGLSRNISNVTSYMISELCKHLITSFVCPLYAKVNLKIFFSKNTLLGQQYL